MPEFLNFLNESLDSSFEINKKEKGMFNTDLYYVNIQDKKYRIFVEEQDKILHIGFERLINGNWTISTITNDLNTKEVLGLFGTILKILKNMQFNGIYIETEDSKKGQLYFNIVTKMNRDLKMVLTRNDHCIMLIKDKDVKINKSNFKYKKENNE